MSKKLTNEDFLQKLEEQGRFDIQPLEEYINTHTKIKFKCLNNKEHPIFEQTPSHVLSRGSGCPLCTIQRRVQQQTYTKEEFIKKLEERFELSYKITSDYINSHTKITCECLLCGNIWDAMPINLIKGTACPKCGFKKISESKNTPIDIYKEKLKQHRPNLEVIEYQTMKKPAKLKCNNGHIWEVNKAQQVLLPYNKENGTGCPYCDGYKLIEDENSLYAKRPDLDKFIIDINEAKQIMAGSEKKIKCKCLNCGYEKEVASFYLNWYGFVCPICSDWISIPNKIIRKVLTLLKDDLEFLEFEYSPDFLGLQRFDAFFIKNGIKYAVEMDGNQHKTKNFKGHILDNNNDLIKDQKSLENDVILIRIDCSDTSVILIEKKIKESILNNILDLNKINWTEVYEYAYSQNQIKEICDLYNNGMKIKNIAELLKINKGTVTKKLKKGTELGWCNYVPKQHKPYKNSKKINPSQIL